MIIVSRHFGLTFAELRSHRRLKRIVHARWVLWWLSHKLGISFMEIGRRTGGFDHATVMLGLRNVEQRRAANADYRDLLDRLLAKVHAEPEPEVEIVLLPPAPKPAPAPTRRVARHDPWAVTGNSFYEFHSNDRRSDRSYLVQQNERFCAAMRAALEQEGQP
jgi:hypothetical protein